MEQNGFGQVDVVASENSGACGAGAVRESGSVLLMYAINKIRCLD